MESWPDKLSQSNITTTKECVQPLKKSSKARDRFCPDSVEMKPAIGAVNETHVWLS